MTHPLAVIAPQIGAPSETFIRRHMCQLLRLGTVVIADTAGGPYGGQWSVDAPYLALDEVHPPRIWRRAAASMLGRTRKPAHDGGTASLRFLRRHGVRVVLSEYLNLSERWFELLQDTEMRFFAHAHGYDVTRRCLSDPGRREAYLKYNAAAGVITMSQTSGDALVAAGLEPEKVHVIPYGVDVPDMPLQRPRRAEIRCVAVGRMVGKKAPIILLDAFRRASERLPELRLDYLGGGDLLPAVRQYVRAFDLTDRVRIPGAVDNTAVLHAMRDADIFLQHSVTDPDTGDEEGLPLAILEAMALALPIVSTRHTGIPEAVVDGHTGFLVDEWDSRAMAECLLEVAGDSKLRERMGNAGWERARERFQWKNERRQLLHVMGLHHDEA